MKAKQIIIAISFLAVSFVGCKPKLIQKEEKLGAKEIVRYQTTEDGKKQGVWERFDSTGKILLETSIYEADSLEGESKLFDMNGKIMEVRHYQNNKFNGSFKSYYPNGQVNSDAMYVSGKFEGEYKRYYQNGKLLESVQFKNNVEDGAFKEYYDNGKIKLEGSYKFEPRFDRAVKNGEITKFDSLTGAPTKNNYQMGRCLDCPQ